MGIKSTENWSGTIINGTTLGEPAVHDDGTFEWDGGVPSGTIDEYGMFIPDGDSIVDGPVSVGFDKMAGVSKLRLDGLEPVFTKNSVMSTKQVVEVEVVDV